MVGLGSFLLFGLLSAPATQAATTNVSSIAALQSAINSAAAARNLLSRPPDRKRSERGRASGSDGVWLAGRWGWRGFPGSVSPTTTTTEAARNASPGTTDLSLYMMDFRTRHSSSDVVLLLLTLVTSILTFSLPRTNVLFGCVHLLLFGAYLMLMFDR